MKYKTKREIEVEVWVCDVCGREVGTSRDAYAYLTKCHHCGREMCDTCRDAGKELHELYAHAHEPAFCKPCWVAGAPYRVSLVNENARHEEQMSAIRTAWKAASVQAVANKAGA